MQQLEILNLVSPEPPIENESWLHQNAYIKFLFNISKIITALHLSFYGSHNQVIWTHKPIEFCLINDWTPWNYYW